jgi:hypothetical protein
VMFVKPNILNRSRFSVRDNHSFADNLASISPNALRSV